MGSCLLVSLYAAASLAAGAASVTPGPPHGDAVYEALFDDAGGARRGVWRVSWGEPEAFPAAFDPPAPMVAALAAEAQQPRPRVAAVEYSNAYRVRARIHKIASIATLPLFGTELYLGQSVYNGSTGGKKSAHVAIGATIGTLFGVNTVTGVWNLWEGRKDPTHRTRRFAHGLLMLAADAGFFATAMLAPESEDEGGFSNVSDRRSTHRAVAITSIGLGTAGYLIMLLGGR